MENLMKGYGWQVFGLLCMIYFLRVAVLPILQYLFFAPYRNKFMKWFMTRYNRHYIDSKTIYDELIKKQEECAAAGTVFSDPMGYQAFYEFMLNDERFRSTDDVRRQLEKNHADSKAILDSGVFATSDIESFVCFRGIGENLHKILVMFNLTENVSLSLIQFFYHEENKYAGFLINLETKKFPPQENDTVGRVRYKPRPVSGPSIKVPDIVLV